MGKIQVLDCTLRDGGYVNKWMFGDKYIGHIMTGLKDAQIDIIECGYLNEGGSVSDDSTNVKTIEQLERHIPFRRAEGTPSYVCMIDYGSYRMSSLPAKKADGIDGIRVAFHKKDMKGALEMCRDIQKKGYDVYIQPMVTLSYSDEEVLKLLQEVNKFCPKAVYIVDSYGSMRSEDLLRLFYLITHNLDKNIVIGYHSHNNLQLAYSNAKELVAVAGKRDIIIDASIFGMGRGAGNLNTELFIDFLNNIESGSYLIAPLLQVMDRVISQIYMLTPWGYSLPYYLSAVHNCHPNYASCLSKRNTLTVEDMDAIFSMLSKKKKNVFDRSYIETLYEEYMSKGGAAEEDLEKIEKVINGRDVLLVAPGKTVDKDEIRIRDFQKNNEVVTIAINSEFSGIDTDYIFVSNIRRFRELDKANYDKTIITCNIESEKVFAKVSYAELENEDLVIRDNAGIMALSLMRRLAVRRVFLAGFDGYSIAMNDNYASKALYLKMDEEFICNMNAGMKRAIEKIKEHLDIFFLTESKLDSCQNSN